MTPLFVICPITVPMMQDRLAEAFEVHQIEDMKDPIGWLQKNGESIEYVLTDGHFGVRADYLELLPNVRAIASNGVGYDAIDTDLTNSRGIPVSHTPDVLSDEVATTTVLLFLSCFRNFVAEANHAASGEWAEKGGLPLARSADNRTVGILGLGRIGKAIATKLAPFNPTILYTGRNEQDVPFEFVPSLEDLARRVDVLICIAPGGASTHHLVDATVIRALGPEGTLINVGRGSVVDEVALIKALQSGELGWAGLDVFEDEPNIPQALRDHPRVTVTPHIGSATIETRAAMGNLAIDNLIEHEATGKMLTPVPESAHLVGRAVET